MRIKYNYILLLIVLSALSCGPKKGIVTKKKNSSSKKEVVSDNRSEESTKGTNEVVVRDNGTRNTVEIYIDLYSEIAKNKMRTHKIPASITLAQGILESGSGVVD